MGGQVLARVLSWSFNRGLISANPCERGGRIGLRRGWDARNKRRQFGAIWQMPGNLRKRTTAWWYRKDSKHQPDRYGSNDSLSPRLARDPSMTIAAQLLHEDCRRKDWTSPLTRASLPSTLRE
jgi:hypothetical protein